MKQDTPKSMRFTEFQSMGKVHSEWELHNHKNSKLKAPKLQANEVVWAWVGWARKTVTAKLVSTFKKMFGKFSCEIRMHINKKSSYLCFFPGQLKCKQLHHRTEWSWLKINLLGPIGRMKKTILVVLKAEWSFPSFPWPAHEETKREAEADGLKIWSAWWGNAKTCEANISQCCTRTQTWLTVDFFCLYEQLSINQFCVAASSLLLANVSILQHPSDAQTCCLSWYLFLLFSSVNRDSPTHACIIRNTHFSKDLGCDVAKGTALSCIYHEPCW